MKIASGTYDPIDANYSSELLGLIPRMLTKNPAMRPSMQEILKTPFLLPYMEKFIFEASQKFPRLKKQIPAPPAPEFVKPPGFVYEYDSLEDDEEYEDDFESEGEEEDEVCRAIEVYRGAIELVGLELDMECVEEVSGEWEVSTPSLMNSPTPREDMIFGLTAPE